MCAAVEAVNGRGLGKNARTADAAGTAMKVRIAKRLQTLVAGAGLLLLGAGAQADEIKIDSNDRNPEGCVHRHRGPIRARHRP